ncbi:MAG: RNA-binding cell elongation regulator Jag/EloR, partial [Candidatus Scatosoma sp.]
MQNFKEFTAKTAEEAIEAGLKELGLTKETAQIRILEEGKKKLFGTVKARVEIAPLKEQEEENTGNTCEENKQNSDIKADEAEKTEGKTDGERAVEFLDGLFELMNITAVTELALEGEKIVINVTAANNNALIGKKGMVLDAAQTLAGAVANIGRAEYRRVVVDCENYRENREETLRRLANNLAAKAVRLGRKIRLEPMNPYERRIIHAALSENGEVSTQSEGKEPARYIVIIPQGVQDNRPALYAGNDRRERGEFNKGRGGRDFRGNRGGKGARYGGSKGGFNRERRMSGGDRASVYKKPDSDFFGTFLGNSGNDGS